jgi:outer membrane immunogenic protein
MFVQRFSLTAVAVAGLSFCFAHLAQAADMPIKAPRMPVAAYYNWSGFYIGANGGYGWGTSKWQDDPSLTASDFGSHGFNGGMAGGQLGYNFHISTIVLGIEADLDWADLKGGHVNPLGNDINTKATALGTVTGRIGYAMSNTLIFAKGGLAWGNFKYDNFITPGGALNGSNSSTRTGWTVGGGFEYGFAPNWSAKIEYDYMDFGTKRLAFSGGVGGSFVQDITDSIHVVKAGVNYRFNP